MFTIHTQKMNNLARCLISVVLQKKVDDVNNKGIISGGDFNLSFACRLEMQGGNPVLKKNSFAKLIQLKRKFVLCDIWRIRKPNTKC